MAVAETIVLPAKLDLNAAADLAARLLALRGRPLDIDAAHVEHLGGLCLQALIAARLTWKNDHAALKIVNSSPQFSAAIDLYGADFSKSE